VQGCVSLHAPLQREHGYPDSRPEPASLGPECQAITRTYANTGVVTAPGGVTQPVLLSGILNVRGEATYVALAVRTRKVDEHRDTFATLEFVRDANQAERRSLDNCFCVRQTLACTQITESYWSIPNLGARGRQTNVYLSIARDRSLIARLQDYRADVVLAMPVFAMNEPWTRFPALDTP
jgi:hypothetical protein